MFRTVSGTQAAGTDHFDADRRAKASTGSTIGRSFWNTIGPCVSFPAARCSRHSSTHRVTSITSNAIASVTG